MRTIKVLKFVAACGWGGTERQFVNLGLGLDRSRAQGVRLLNPI